MKILLLHSDFLEYEAVKRTRIAEDVSEDMRKQRIEEVLVVFTAVEPGDLEKVEKAAEEVEKVRNMVKAKNLFLYPFAHLSDNLAKPEEAIEVLNKLAKRLKCKRAPFGWYKRFTISVKGHPIAELSRRI